MMIIRGVNVFPSQIETVLLNEGYEPNYQIIVDRVKNNDTFDVNVEMNPDQLWDTTLNPETRVLMQVTIEEAAEAERLITTLMGDNVDERKKYIQLHANFNKEDDFEIKVKD